MNGSNNIRILDYETVRQEIGNRRSYLLLGNGFSISCDPVFSYPSLFQAAVSAGLSIRAQDLFIKLGVNNFEGVMRLLSNSHWVAQVYGYLDSDSSRMLEDLEVIKQTLVEAIANSHLPFPSTITANRMASALKFIDP